ncbi:MAG TPA: iron-containing alcohol dehydrogenase [Xanthobacteraceae bacterium]|nr:iron-containing alcohol dehydrogenase [Xanthobacteraceae bacterium]
MRDTFFFQLDNRLHYGVGWSRGLGDFLRQLGWANVALLIDEGVAAHNPYYREIRPVLDAAATVTELRLRGSEEPSYDYLDSLAAQIRVLPALDGIVAIGGGSALDSAKALACLRTNPGPSVQYRGFDKITVPPVPTICIPSTAGTGSEVTINAVFTDTGEKRKLGINGRHLNATYAVLDAEWTMSCPPSVAISSGMDALVHTLESFMTGNANPLTRCFNREAFRLLYENLPCLVDAPHDKEKRQLLLLGSYLAAIGLFNSGSGIAGALSYPIGVHFKVPHGIGGGIFIASVVDYNVARGWYDYAELLDLVEPHPDWSRERKAKRFAEAIRQLADRLDVPRTLDRWGITRRNVDQVVGLMQPLQAAFNQNPVPFAADSDVRDMLMRHTA